MHLMHETSELCKSFQITLTDLYPNAIHILKPCDVAAFHPLKAQWNKAFLRWCKNHLHEAMTKVHIALILKIPLKMVLGTPFSADTV